MPGPQPFLTPTDFSPASKMSAESLVGQLVALGMGLELGGMNVLPPPAQDGAPNSIISRRVFCWEPKSCWFSFFPRGSGVFVYPTGKTHFPHAPRIHRMIDEIRKWMPFTPSAQAGVGEHSCVLGNVPSAYHPQIPLTADADSDPRQKELFVLVGKPKERQGETTKPNQSWQGNPVQVDHF